MGLAWHGVLAVLIWLFAIWESGAALVIGQQSTMMTHVRTCKELREALEQELPDQDVLMDEDITCTKEDWGEPVIVSGDKLVLGIQTIRYTIPTLRFVDVVEGVVVPRDARLALQKIVLKSEMLIQDSRGNGTHPPPFVKVAPNGTLDFVGAQVCCQDCHFSVQEEKLQDHRPIEQEEYVDDSLPFPGLTFLDGPPQGNPVIEQAPTSLCNSDPEYVKWSAGDFVNGGSYHFCSSLVACNPGRGTNSAFVYYVDRTMQICETSTTVTIISHRETNTSQISRTVEIVAIFAPSALCVVLIILLAISVWRSGGNAGGNYRNFRARGGSIGCHSHEISTLRPCHQRTSTQEEFTGTEQTHNDENSVVVSTTALSFGCVQVDLTSLLGQGGFSSVYKGTFQGNLAAIKIVEHSQGLKAECSGELAEVHLHRNLYHPYIVVTYCSKDVPTDILPMSYGDRNSPSMSIGFSRSCSPRHLLSIRQGKRFPTNSTKGSGDNKCTLIVMEYCERGNLFEAIHQGEFFRQDMRGAPDFLVILRCALDVAVAMRYLHSKGIVHGDLKPENVLRKTLAEDDRGFICKVSDFGLSRMIPINTFLQTATLGTITHMPPELLRDGILAPSADIYSFGIMLWEMISGGFPFHGMTQHDIILAVVGSTRPPMPRFIPRDLWTLIQNCWHEDHLRRPSFVTVIGVLQDALKEVLRQSPSDQSIGFPSVPEIMLRMSSGTPQDKSPGSTPTPSTTPCASSESTTPLSGFDTWEPFGDTELEAGRFCGNLNHADGRNEIQIHPTDNGLSSYDEMNQVTYHRPITHAPGSSYHNANSALIRISPRGQDRHTAACSRNLAEPISNRNNEESGYHTAEHSPFVHAGVNPLSDMCNSDLHAPGDQVSMTNITMNNPTCSKGYWDLPT